MAPLEAPSMISFHNGSSLQTSRAPDFLVCHLRLLSSSTQAPEDIARGARTAWYGLASGSSDRLRNGTGRKTVSRSPDWPKNLPNAAAPGVPFSGTAQPTRPQCLLALGADYVLTCLALVSPGRPFQGWQGHHSRGGGWTPPLSRVRVSLSLLGRI